MSKAAKRLGASASFSSAGPAISARRAAIAAATEAPTAGTASPPPAELPLAEISENPDNPREEIGDVSALAVTLQEIGLVQAITVATVDAYLASHPTRADELEPGARYVVIDGHRRHAAAKEAGLESIKYVINDAFVSSDEKLLEAAYVANLQRKCLSELEEAAALEKLVSFYGSQGKAANRLGVSQGFISQRLSLLKLAPELQADLESGERKVEHLRGLGSLPADEQKKQADVRAQRARKAAESHHHRDVSAEPAATPAAESLPRSSERTESHYGVMDTARRARDTEPKGSSSVDGQQGASLPEPRPPLRKPADSSQVSEALSAALPWHDVEAVRDALFAFMPESEVRRLAAMLVAELPA
ncbi:ParB/RepB/Spo0J family partition protein [Streptomyces lydicus]|uniref:ParB/RepB/Spo0J family partition protein n=1 Tax=Streptomyces lydicus TaxID=47763 RepID=UPI0036E3DC34